MRFKSLFSSTIALCVVASNAAAAPPTKDQCIDAHSRGQDSREGGKLALARELFITCGQSTCPPAIQADCARFGDDIGRLLPTVTFAARDAQANDLPATRVYLDDALMAIRLDDGKSYEVDPGRHTVRFVFEGKETVVNVVINQGEKGRQILGTFAAVSPSLSITQSTSADPLTMSSPEPSRPMTPLVFAGVGAVATVTGAVLMGVGLGNVPSSCSVSTHQCAAAPGDAVFSEAESGVGTMNVGLGIGSVGAAALIGSLVWYFLTPAE